jgi:hypothetical protein
MSPTPIAAGGETEWWDPESRPADRRRCIELRSEQVYERRQHHLLPWPAFLRRAARHLLWACLIIACAVLIGTVGYHSAGRLGWLDAFLNASMILSGMGPVDRMEHTAGKLFSALYALFSGLVFVGATGIIVAPWAHRLFHWIHVEAT